MYPQVVRNLFLSVVAFVVLQVGWVVMGVHANPPFQSAQTVIVWFLPIFCTGIFTYLAHCRRDPSVYVPCTACGVGCIVGVTVRTVGADQGVPVLILMAPLAAGLLASGVRNARADLELSGVRSDVLLYASMLSCGSFAAYGFGVTWWNGSYVGVALGSLLLEWISASSENADMYAVEERWRSVVLASDASDAPRAPGDVLGTHPPPVAAANIPPTEEPPFDWNHPFDELVPPQRQSSHADGASADHKEQTND